MARPGSAGTQGTQKPAAALKIISRNILKMDKPLSFVALEQLVYVPT
jgi:hypothetical protein